MERLLALALFSLALAGCTAPSPEQGALPAPDGGSAIQPSQEGAAGRAPEGEGRAPLPPAPSPTPAPEPDPPPAPPPAEEPAKEPAPAPTPAAPPAEGPAPEPERPTPEPDAKEPAQPPAPRARLPSLEPGDRWEYRGMTAQGGVYRAWQQVRGLGQVQGRGVYVLDAAENGASTTLRLTLDGISPVNDTGFVTELLRFPMGVGSAWSFGAQRTHQVGPDENRTTWAGNVTEGLRGNVSVAALENVTTPAGVFEAYRLQANLTYSAGGLQRTLQMQYWYAPAVKGLARLEAAHPSGARDWSELTSFSR